MDERDARLPEMGEAKKDFEAFLTSVKGNFKNLANIFTYDHAKGTTTLNLLLRRQIRKFRCRCDDG